VNLHFVRRTSRQRARRAQSLVEFALILPVMLVLLLGMIDLGRAFVFGVAVQNGAREAARLGAKSYLDPTMSDAQILQRLIDASSPALIGCRAVSGAQPVDGCSTWTLSVSPSVSRSTGGTVTVTAVGQPSLLAGFFSGAMGLSLAQITVQGQAVMEVL
jgi:Flp pilus assembly protein TadG